MLIRICYPCFDTRFYRAADNVPPLDAQGSEPILGGTLEPGWLFDDSPRTPRFERAGGLGLVTTTIPPADLARCQAGGLISLHRLVGKRIGFETAEPEGGSATLRVTAPEITATADRFGQVCIAMQFAVHPSRPGLDLQTILAAVMAAAVDVLNPAHRGTSCRLDQAGDELADCYGRETGRTSAATPSPERGGYRIGWVRAGRPFVLVVAKPSDRIGLRGPAFDCPVVANPFDGLFRFVPLLSADLSLPVWTIVPQRGGAAWKSAADGIEQFMAGFEQYMVCLAERDECRLAPPPGSEEAVRLERHVDRLRGILLRGQRAKLDLPRILRLLLDYREAQLRYGMQSGAELDRITGRQAAVKAAVLHPQDRNSGQACRLGDTIIVNIGGGTGNIINLGQMIAETISTTNTVLEGAKPPESLKARIEELRAAVSDAAGKMDPDQAAELLEDFESFTKQAVRKEPNPAVVKAQGESIVGAVSKVAGLATPIVGLVAAVVKALGY